MSVVARITKITPHPDPEVTRLELISVSSFDGPFGSARPPGWPRIQLVTGKHYRVGDLGVWIRPGAWIPGWLAHDLWLVGKKRAGKEWFEVREIAIKGVPSPGLWCGQFYMNDGSQESIERFREYGGDNDAHGARGPNWVSWPYWQKQWQPGDVLDSYLGVLDFNPRAAELVR